MNYLPNLRSILHVNVFNISTSPLKLSSSIKEIHTDSDSFMVPSFLSMLNRQSSPTIKIYLCLGYLGYTTRLFEILSKYKNIVSLTSAGMGVFNHGGILRDKELEELEFNHLGYQNHGIVQLAAKHIKHLSICKFDVKEETINKYDFKVRDDLVVDKITIHTLHWFSGLYTSNTFSNIKELEISNINTGAYDRLDMDDITKLLKLIKKCNILTLSYLPAVPTNIPKNVLTLNVNYYANSKIILNGHDQLTININNPSPYIEEISCNNAKIVNLRGICTTCVKKGSNINVISTRDTPHIRLLELLNIIK